IRAPALRLKRRSLPEYEATVLYQGLAVDFHAYLEHDSIDVHSRRIGAAQPSIGAEREVCSADRLLIFEHVPGKTRGGVGADAKLGQRAPVCTAGRECLDQPPAGIAAR